MCVQGPVEAKRGQQNPPLELELLIIVSHLTWALGTELRSLARTAIELDN